MYVLDVQEGDQPHNVLKKAFLKKVEIFSRNPIDRGVYLLKNYYVCQHSNYTERNEVVFISG